LKPKNFELSTAGNYEKEFKPAYQLNGGPTKLTSQSGYHAKLDGCGPQ
jgi:hypothetical protein